VVNWFRRLEHTQTHRQHDDVIILISLLNRKHVYNMPTGLLSSCSFVLGRYDEKINTFIDMEFSLSLLLDEKFMYSYISSGQVLYIAITPRLESSSCHQLYWRKVTKFFRISSETSGKPELFFFQILCLHKILYISPAIILVFTTYTADTALLNNLRIPQCRLRCISRELHRVSKKYFPLFS
jgi:hypothetical protein